MRRWAWPFTIGMLLALLITTTTVTVVVYFVRADVLSLTQARKTTEVATCYASARGRPSLIVILRVIGGVTADSSERAIISGFIDGYEDSTPSIGECDSLARMRGLDPEDFPEPDPPRQRSEEREDAAP